MLVEHSIKINAPTSTVWNVTTDVERWPDWTPTVTNVDFPDDRPLGKGSTVKIKQPGQPEAEWTVTEYVPEKCFVWESRRPGLIFTASHTLTTDGANTVCTLRVEASGIWSKLLSPVLKRTVSRALEKENKGLKARCEELSETKERRSSTTD